jgi:hypothetical protein
MLQFVASHIVACRCNPRDVSPRCTLNSPFQFQISGTATCRIHAGISKEQNPRSLALLAERRRNSTTGCCFTRMVFFFSFLAGSFSSDVESQSMRDCEGGWDRGFTIPMSGAVYLVYTLNSHEMKTPCKKKIVRPNGVSQVQEQVPTAWPFFFAKRVLSMRNAKAGPLTRQSNLLVLSACKLFLKRLKTIRCCLPPKQTIDY